ncbi:MAG TPA: PQQ-binding-like beta-propeller repeat protein [Verrucomicrobiota bacterium]|nr:PQQ-binding-like beta-propeller repeat protein [Verrucomicrobiota bacterium]HNU49826.1 PQQ-binding-like beta-propeller repeat protein [Verrucomicrobiota bacterium]
MTATAHRRVLLMIGLWLGGLTAWSDDWPQWMGPRRDGVWRETGILERFPDAGLVPRWKTAIRGGYVGPAVAGNRLFLLDRQAGTMPERKKGETSLPQIPGNERVLCLDAATGARVWEHTYDCAYRIDYPAGPRATPVIADGRVFTLGAMGDLRCLRAGDGTLVWSRQLLMEFQLSDPPLWGWAGHPVLDGNRLICLVGGPGSAVVAFDKETGREEWRALTAVEIGYAPPALYTVNGRRELIVWHPDGVAGLAPETGAVLWSHAYPVGGKPQRPEVAIAMPRLEGDRLLLTSFYQGSLLLQLAVDGPKVVWNRRSTSKSTMNDGLHAVMTTPLFKDGFIYGCCGFGELRCLDAATGDRRWETYAATGGKKAFFGTAFLVEHEDRAVVWNDQGELILARLEPEGYTEISRTRLLEPLENTRGRTVLWCAPAFANRCVYVHNGHDLICVSLAAGPS